MTKDSNDSEAGDNRCVDCGKRPPPTDTNYTLISTRHGWRLTRAVRDDGLRVMEWRCPSCWQVHRKKLNP